MAFQDPHSTIWILVCTILVFMMQLGFLMLEAGAVRAKNSVNVAVKNLADLCLSALLFWVVGFAILFDGSLMHSPTSLGDFAFFFFQVAFCGTAATIVSGAVAERMTFNGYLLTTAVITVLIYPVIGNWAWASLDGGPVGWLEAQGFVDFAGSTVVHSVGGWVALAAVIIIGPRLGRFDGDGEPLIGANLGMSVAGAVVLWIGWFGFNGGSVLALNDTVGGVLRNTLAGGASGGCACVLWDSVRGRRVAPLALCNGVIAGFVAVTANAHLGETWAAGLIGAIGAMVAVGVGRLLEMLCIDDPVGAIPAHLGAGIWGTLAVAFVMPDVDVMQQFGVQFLGVAAAGFWAFGITFVVLRGLEGVVALRVAPEVERAGLSVSEHGTISPLIEVIAAMEAQRRSGDFSGRLLVRPEDDAGMVAQHYNGVLDRVQSEIASREDMADQLEEARDAALAASRAKTEFLSVMSHELRTPMNGLLGLSAVLATTTLDSRQAMMVRTIRSCGDSLVAVLGDMLDFVESTESPAHQASQGDEFSTVSLTAICGAVGSRHRPEAVQKGLSVEIRCSDPPGLERSGDMRALLKIVDHLLGNAVKFTETGTVVLDVTACDRKAVMVVRDTGPGIPKAMRARLFNPFEQGDSSSTRRYGGTGIGLAVVAELTRRMGGEIEVHDREGGGTVFIVRVPCPALEVSAMAGA